MRICAPILYLAAAVCASSAVAAEKPPEPFKGMQYRLVGPWRGGRSLTAVGTTGDVNTYYAGYTGGGVWKTTNGGGSWKSLFDDEAVSSIGAIAVSTTDPSVVYVGTGEACIRGNLSHGDGVYKSTDAGKTWTNVGLKDTRHIGAVVVHPRDPDVVYVAALGHVYGPNAERGVFRSKDGGKTWDKVLYKDEKTGAVDLEMDPRNPSILFAVLWEANRTPWSLTSGGPGSGLYRSADGGSSWKKVEGKGWPDVVLGKIGVSVSGGDSQRVYAMVEAADEKGGLYRSDDGGESWKHITDDHRLRHRPWYYTHVTADTREPDTVYVLSVGLYRSRDGGTTWTPIETPHGDYHGMWIDPADPKRMAVANDGGATITVDGGETWSRQDNQPTAQFYHVSVDDQWPYTLYGSQQDNSSVAIRSRSDQGAITRADWNAVGGGEAGYISATPDGGAVYAGEYFGILTRFDRKTGQAHNVSVWPDNTDGHEAANLKYRFNWTEPILVSRHDPSVVYYAGNVVFRTSDGGMSWTPISGDLTRNDKAKQQRSGGPVTGENISIEYYDVVFSLAESPRQKGLLWAGTDDGLVHLTRDDGKTWANVTPKDLPVWSLVSQIDASPHDPAAAYLAVDRHELDDYKPYAWATRDYGQTWRRLSTAGIPDGSFVRAVREDPVRKGLLYAGTETGVFVSFDDGARWQPLKLNLPTVPVHDLVVKNDDLVLATHGRAFWILDDVAPLRQWNDGVGKADVHLFTPSPAYRFRGGSGRGSFQGKNPPAGAVLYYQLAQAQTSVRLEVLDESGKVIRSYKSEEEVVPDKPLPESPEPEEKPDVLPKEAGLHRFVWNLRHDKPKLLGSAIFDMGPPDMPMVLPGAYQIRLVAGGKSLTAPVEVRLDPRVTTSAADLRRQFDAMVEIRETLGRAHETILEIRAVRSQLKALKERLGDSEKGKAVVAAADALDAKTSPLEAGLLQLKARSSQDMCNWPTMLNSKLAWLSNVVDSADAAPTRQALELFAELKARTEALVGPWKQALARDVPALNELMQKEGVPAVGLAGAP
ncbi:MAG TPA: glycosyl hydrolase [Vicinamibacteria bacterium]